MNLITRICKCGCDQSFKCLETSSQRYYSNLHKYADFAKQIDFKKSSLRRGEKHIDNGEEWEFVNIFRSESSLKGQKKK